MEIKEMDLLLTMFPYFTHAVERICTPSWHLKKEVHTNHNLILIYGGEAVFNCNANEYIGSKGHLLYFKPGDIRWANTYSPNLMKCFAIDFSYTCPVFHEGNWALIDTALPFETFGKINDHYLFTRLLELFNNFVKTWISGKQNRYMRCRAIFMEILNLLLLLENGKDLNYDKLKKVEKVISFMTDHYAESITIETLASIVQISKSYLMNIFKEVTGKSAMDYLIGIRMNKAKGLIQDGHSIMETAQIVGFSDTFYFSKCFKKREGMAPSVYRKI